MKPLIILSFAKALITIVRQQLLQVFFVRLQLACVAF